MSKSSGRKKHHEFHFSLDFVAIDNPEAGAGVGVDGDGGDSGDKDSGRVDVDSVDSDDGVCGGDPDGEDEEEDSDIGD